MDNKVLGVVKTRQRNTPNLHKAFVNITNICDRVIVADVEGLLTP